MVEVTFIAAFIAGVLSFISPCILPIIPGFMAYLSGTSIKGEGSRLKIFFNSLSFVLGFSVIFALLGVLLNSILEGVAYDVQTWLSRIGGIIIILFGLHLTELIQIPFLMSEHRIQVKKGRISYVTSFLFGAAFAVGWSPCVGAVLGAVLGLAVSQPGLAFGLLLSYALGLGIPFLVVGVFTEKAMRVIQRSGRVLKYYNIIVGSILIILGILVFTNHLASIANLLLPKLYIG